MKLFRVPATEPLTDYDPGLAQRLSGLLVAVLQRELGESPSGAAARADQVSWSVRRAPDGLWLEMGHLGVGGDWRSDEAGLTLYVRQLAYELLDRGGATSSPSRCREDTVVDAVTGRGAEDEVVPSIVVTTTVVVVVAALLRAAGSTTTMVSNVVVLGQG